MKAGKVNVKIRKISSGVSEIDFQKNGRSFFCADFKFNETVAKQYVSKLEENLVSPEGLCSALLLKHPEGDRITVEIDSREKNFEHINIEELWKLESKYIGHLIITYPVNEGRETVNKYTDRLVYKKDIIEELYREIVSAEPCAKSELIESILANGDLDSFYERIA